MTSDISEPIVQLDKPLSKIDASQQQPQHWKTRAPLIVFAVFVTAIWGSVWWSSLLSAEEQACLGCWGSIDTVSDLLPNGTSSLTFYRELHFLSGHEVQLRVWAEGDPERVNAVPAFGGGRACLYPLRGDSSRSLTTTPHPAVIPGSIFNESPPTVNVTGHWKLRNGQIEIEWDLNKSLFRTIQEKYSLIVHRKLKLYFSENAHGKVTRNGDDQLIINWILSSTRNTGYTPPPQVWSRQPDKR